MLIADRVSSVSSREPVVSSVGLGSSESSTASPVSEQAFRPQFTLDQHLAASGSNFHLVLTVNE